MQQTAAHEIHYPALLALLPVETKRLVEIGCGSGALAREYKKANADCHYVGIDIMPEYAELAKRHCDEVLAMDIENANLDFLGSTLAADCWIFGDSLEHLRDPWALLKNIRKTIAANGCVVACIPNGQHWSAQARLNIGEFRYEEAGLFDRSHLRWFTRITIMEMFADCGFRVEQMEMFMNDDPGLDRCIPAIRLMAETWGRDPDQAVRDATAVQYVIRAVPDGYTTTPSTNPPASTQESNTQAKPQGMLGKLGALFK
jgi:SAM-dependent methyltransferase